jgi:hypothetical protein
MNKKFLKFLKIAIVPMVIILIGLSVWSVNALGTGTNSVQVKIEYTTAAAEGVNGRPLGVQIPSITAIDSQGQTKPSRNCCSL